MNERKEKTVRIQPAPPTSLVQEIPTPDAVHTADTLREQGRGDIPSDTQGSYTGTDADGEAPEQDPDDL